MKALRVAIVGAGKVSTEHIGAYRNAGVEVVAICSRTKEGAQRKADEFGLSAHAYDNFDRLLEKEDIDIVSLCSSPELHAEQTIKAALAGKHIAIEKPVALNRKELEAMHQAVSDAGVKTIVGFVLRWNDLVLNIKNRYIGSLGRVFYIETDYWHGSSHSKPHILHEYGSRTKPIGAFLGGGCHAVDMARFLMGSDIETVRALTPKTDEAVQRTTMAAVTFRNGAVGKISATDEVFMPYVFNVLVFGNDGVIRLNRYYARNSEGEDYSTIPGVVPDSGIVDHHPFNGMISEFIECIHQNRETSCSLQEALNTHLVCFAAEASARKGGRKITVSR